MTAFTGIVAFDGNLKAEYTDERIARPLAARSYGRVVTQRAQGALFAQRSNPAADRSAGGGDKILFAADARLDNREELAAALAMSLPELATVSDGDLIFRMYRRWGDAGLARCLGAFAFALWDSKTRQLTLGRDCLGNKALFFHRGDGFVAFASMLGDLLALPDVPRQIDKDMVADFLAVNFTEPRRTLYAGIERVPSRSLIVADRSGPVHRRYWSPNFGAPPPFAREQDYIDRARELFDQAVVSATSDTPDVAISASGGLDSSAIAATVARLGRAKMIACYTVVPPAGVQIDVGPRRYIDERGKMAALARLYPALDIRCFAPEALHPNELDPTRFFLELGLPSIGTAVLGPYSYMFDAVAAAGHRVLLVGNRGNFGLTWRGSYSLRALLRGGQWTAFAHELSALVRQDNNGVARTLMGQVIHPILPRGVRRAIHRLRGRDPDDVARFSALNPAYIADRDLPEKWRTQGFDPWFALSEPDPARYRAHLLFDENQMARDMRGMSGEASGFEYRDPHSDRRLLEFALTVPEPMYRRDGVPRSFARAVFADRLPAEILNERRRGAQTVTWFRNLDARRQTIAAELEMLEGSPTARSLIDLPRLKQLMREWPADEHAAERRMEEYRLMLNRALHAGQFIRWVEGGNA